MNPENLSTKPTLKTHPASRVYKLLPPARSGFIALLALAWLVTGVVAEAACRRPVPTAVPFDKGSARDSCPSNYSMSGSLCSPSGSSAKYVLMKPSSTSSCPNNYSSSGSFCIAESGSCHAFASSSGSCPSGYSSSRPWCMSD